MSFKKDIIISMVTGLLGMALISGGTFSYFSDTEVITPEEISSGTLDLGVVDISKKDDEVNFEMGKIQPGDEFGYSFELSNKGNLDIGKVNLNTDYTVNGKKPKKKDIGSQIAVKSIVVDGYEIIKEEQGLTLYDLSSEEGETLIDLLKALSENEGNQIINVKVLLEFTQKEGKQNEYQGKTIKLTWTFDAMQYLKEENK